VQNKRSLSCSVFVVWFCSLLDRLSKTFLSYVARLQQKVAELVIEVYLAVTFGSTITFFVFAVVVVIK